jgi:hypothetical protein
VTGPLPAPASLTQYQRTHRRVLVECLDVGETRAEYRLHLGRRAIPEQQPDSFRRTAPQHTEPIFPRWTLPGASAVTPATELTPPKERLQRFSFQKRRRELPHRGLSPAHKTLLLRSASEIRPPGAPRTPGDGFRTRLSGRPTSPRGTGRAQAGDPLQDPGEQLSRDGDFRQLEGEVLGVGYHLGPDLDQLLLIPQVRGWWCRRPPVSAEPAASARPGRRAAPGPPTRFARRRCGPGGASIAG